VEGNSSFPIFEVIADTPIKKKVLQIYLIQVLHDTEMSGMKTQRSGESFPVLFLGWMKKIAV
jgi:hypothetical protein